MARPLWCKRERLKKDPAEAQQQDSAEGADIPYGCQEVEIARYSHTTTPTPRNTYFRSVNARNNRDWHWECGGGMAVFMTTRLCDVAGRASSRRAILGLLRSRGKGMCG